MEKQYNNYDYQLTSDSSFLSQRFGNTPELVAMFEDLMQEIHNKKNKKIIDKLNSLILKYPNSPQLKNFLSVAFYVSGNYAKSVEVNNWILTEHPDYLFAILNKANEYINNDEPERVPEILGDAMELKALYPDRDLFHIGEFTGFYKTVIRYYISVNNIELAENRYEILKELAPDHQDTEMAFSFIFEYLNKKGAERWEEENKKRISPANLKPLPVTKKHKEPQFNHSEISDLYKYGFHIPRNIFNDILELPRQTLIQDLENILIDAVDRYDYFLENGWEEETSSFALHAIFLLKELNAEDSLQNIYSFLEYDREFLDFFIGDHITTTLWQCFYTLGFNQTDLLKQFLLKSGVDTYVKTSISEAICQMVLYNPEKREEVLAVYTDVYNVFLNSNIEDNLIDTDFLGLSIGDTIDCDLKELLPIIQQLYEKGYVALGINGDYEAVVREFNRLIKRDYKKDLFNIFEIYDDVITSWAGYKEDYNDTQSYKPLIPQQAVSNKIGRNEPCPCGSGKKYKKCCMDKD